MSPRRRRILLTGLAVLALTLIAAPAAFAAAGGGSSGFSGGGGGGGHGNGFALYLIFDLLIHIALLGHGLGALFLVACGLLYLFVTKLLPKLVDWWAQRQRRGGIARRNRRPSQRERRVQLASAEAADEDPEFAADEIVANATKLFAEIQQAWDAGDRRQLGTLAAPDLMVEWDRRLDDFDRRGWTNHRADARRSRRSSWSGSRIRATRPPTTSSCGSTRA